MGTVTYLDEFRQSHTKREKPPRYPKKWPKKKKEPEFLPDDLIHVDPFCEPLKLVGSTNNIDWGKFIDLDGTWRTTVDLLSSIITSANPGLLTPKTIDDLIRRHLERSSTEKTEE